MVDIPRMIEEKYKDEKQDFLKQLQISLASNNRVMGDESYKELINNLAGDSVKEKVSSNTLDREAMEILRFHTNRGINRKGG